MQVHFVLHWVLLWSLPWVLPWVLQWVLQYVVQCVAVCCGVLQCVAVLTVGIRRLYLLWIFAMGPLWTQHAGKFVAGCCRVCWGVAGHLFVLVCGGVGVVWRLQHTLSLSSVLQCVAVHCCVLQCIAVGALWIQDKTLEKSFKSHMSKVNSPLNVAKHIDIVLTFDMWYQQNLTVFDLRVRFDVFVSAATHTATHNATHTATYCLWCIWLFRRPVSAITHTAT